LEQYKAYYANLITYYAKQLEYVEVLWKNGEDFAKKDHKSVKLSKKPTILLSACLVSQQKPWQCRHE